MNRADLNRAFEATPLFADKTWILSPEAFPLSEDVLERIRPLGPALAEFQLALERLYRRAAENRRILRNEDLDASWVVDYLDRGKPDDLVAHGRHPGLKNELPAVIRPDLLLTEDGFRLTEIDAVPGGVGLTGFLNDLYRNGGGVVENGEGMADGFFRAITGGVDPYENPFVAIVVSEEAATYRPEMEWLASRLQRKGRRVFVFHPDDLMVLGETVCASLDGNPEKVDVLYRFWELFDLPLFPWAEGMLRAVEAGTLRVTPPMKHYHEEKLNLGLFHHPRLKMFWEENLSGKTREMLAQVIPDTWIVDPAPVPPNAFLHAPSVGGLPISSWDELGAGSRKERALILKVSGFHETAWGARSVVLGNDVSRENWTASLRAAMRAGDERLHVLQRYHKPTRVRHPVFGGTGEEVTQMEGRVRLCPFFLADGEGGHGLEGILATVCPADKKIIHGMSDATLLPVRPVAADAAPRESRKGFTLLEILLVIALIGLMSGFLLTDWGNVADSFGRRDWKEATEEAFRRGHFLAEVGSEDVVLRLDAEAGEFVFESGGAGAEVERMEAPGIESLERAGDSVRDGGAFGRKDPFAVRFGADGSAQPVVFEVLRANGESAVLRNHPFSGRIWEMDAKGADAPPDEGIPLARW